MWPLSVPFVRKPVLSQSRDGERGTYLACDALQNRPFNETYNSAFLWMRRIISVSVRVSLQDDCRNERIQKSRRVPSWTTSVYCRFKKI